MQKEYKLDEKDRKILIELDNDARQTDSEIAKKVRLSKQTTNNRIKNLIKRKIISNFYTLLDVGKLGYSSHYLFLQLENINDKEEISLLEKIKEKDYVGWLINGTGRWDVVIFIYSDSTLKFDHYLNDILELGKDHIHEYKFTTLIKAEHIGYKFLDNKSHKIASQSDRKPALEINETDKKILKTISQNSRLSIVEISEKVRIPIHVVRYHLKELIKKQIIESFKPKIEINQLGLQWHLLLIQYKASSKHRKQQFINFCHNHSKVYYLTQTIGEYNLMLDIHVKNTEEFKKVLFELKEEYSDVIKIYESIIVFNEYKIDYFTDLFI